MLAPKALKYESSAELTGDPARALEFAFVVLTGVGFRITARREDAVELVGPGLSGSRENGLRGASAIRLHAVDGRLRLQAELGGLRRLINFVRWFPVSLCLFLAVVLWMIFSRALGRQVATNVVVVIVGLNASLWLALGPILTRRFTARTISSLDALLANAAALG